MTQVLLKDSIPSVWDGAAFNVTISTPPGLASEQQLMLMTHYSGTVPAPQIDNWVMLDSGTLGNNSLTAYKRVLSEAVTVGGVTARFNDAVEGIAWVGNFNGEINSVSVQAILEYTATARPISSVTAQAANARQLFAAATARNPRQADTPAGFAEQYDAAQYAGAGGLALHVFDRAIGAGVAAASSYDLRLTDIDGGTGGTVAGSQTLAVNIALEEFQQVNIAQFDVLAEFPTISVTATPSLSTITVGQSSTINGNAVGSTQGVSYSIISGPGTVNASGVMTPTASGSVVVRVTSVEAPSVFTDATISVRPAAPVVNPVSSGQSPRTVTGTAEPGASVSMTVGGDVYAVSATGAGDWSVDLNLPVGSYDLFVTQLTNGQLSDAAGPIVIEVVAEPPMDLDAPVIYAVASGEGDKLIRGSGEPTARIRLLVSSELRPEVIIVNAEGEWSVLLSLAVGSYNASAFQVKDLLTSTTGNIVTFNVHPPAGPPPETMWGARKRNESTDARGGVPVSPVTADPSLAEAPLSTPFKTPKAWPAKPVKFPKD